MTRLPLLAFLLASPSLAAPTFTVRIIDERSVDTGRPLAKPVQCPDAQGNPGPCDYPMSSGTKTDWPSYPDIPPASLQNYLEVATWTLSSSGAVPVPQTWPVQIAYRAFPFADLAKLPICDTTTYFDFTPELRLQVTMFDEARC